MLNAGSRLGSYEILSSLGAGGMGEVYRARDTKLGRDVAIKVLPELFAADAERLARFQREAQLLAALNHPNIAAIYGLEDAPSTSSRQAGATRFIVMELVEGESLDARLKARAQDDGARGFSRALPVDEALRIARQIVDAFEAAHDKGIVHRDLKPANVMLTEDGHVKVLDFGLAKLDASDSGGSGVAGAPGGLTHSPTVTFAATQAGMILGTAAYMSPEQARGRSADKRSDVWAFGCVLFEMLTGKRAFEGDDVTDIIAAVVRAEPDWSALPADVPPAIRAIVQRCLVKDRKARIPDMSVVRFLIADAASPSAGTGSATSRSVAPHGAGRRIALVATGGFVAGAIVAALITWTLTRPQLAPAARPARFAILAPGDLPLGTGNPDRSIVIAPDGSHVVSINGATIGGGGRLTVRALDQLESVAVKGVTNARAPFISPDSRWIGYFESGELKKVPIAGGPPIRICAVIGGTRGSTWGPDNTIVYATNESTTGLAQVSAGGGEPKILTKPDTTHGEVDHLFPTFLPGGRVVLFTITTGGSIDNAMIASLDLKTGERKILIRGGSHPDYAASGHLLYAAAGSLRAVRFDPERLEVLSDPAAIVDTIRTEPSGAAHFSVSQNGSLVYVVGGSGIFESRALVWVDRRGREEPIDAPPRAYLHPRLSPDGSRIAVAITDQEQDVWVLDTARQPLTRLTFGPSTDQYPVWTPDGTRVLYRSDRAGIPNVFWQRADGTGTVEQVTSVTQQLLFPNAMTPDGNTIVASWGQHLALVRLDDRQKVTPIAVSQGAQINPAISPDGRWLAYQSSESGSFEIYVRPFPNVDAGRWQISSSGGVKPTWARNGRELFYLLATDGSMTAVPVQTGTTFTFGGPVKLFEGRYYSAPQGRTYDVSGDAQRFLMIKVVERPDQRPSAPPSVVIVLNAFEELNARMPGRK